MALIALAADKGSPGVTTTAVALAAVWPRRALLAELDPAGGDLVYRGTAPSGRTLDPNTGMLSLAATARRGLAAEQLWDHTQRMAGGLDVLLGLGTAEQSVGLAGQWDALGRAFASLAESPHQEAAADVVADCGRVGPQSPVLDTLQHAAMLVLVTRTEPEHLARVRDRAAALSARLHGTQRGAAQLGLPAIGVLLIADAHGDVKVAAQVNNMLVSANTGARVIGVVADDAAGAGQLAGRRRGRVEKSLLVRSVRKVVADLQQNYAAAWAPQPQPQAAAAQSYARQQYSQAQAQGQPPSPGQQAQAPQRAGQPTGVPPQHGGQPPGAAQAAGQEPGVPAHHRVSQHTTGQQTVTGHQPGPQQPGSPYPSGQPYAEQPHQRPAPPTGATP
ncbi:hypothetical protein [Streptomyces sp. JJ66]|uniref:hypothetical protein n=1 Tax=Streptomyces sp. JJ66 TaxID=2803843 RepID=UPI00214CE7F6|nr:hypothetical protein [Streptomyces sp. JJ66]